MTESADTTQRAERRRDRGDDFFTVGPPLNAVRASYRQRQADEAMFRALLAGHHVQLHAANRTGKTSLVAAVAARLRSHGVAVAVLDLDQISFRDGGGDAGRWHYSVAYRILRQLRIRYDLQAWWQDKAVLSSRQRLFEFYAEVLLPNEESAIAILVDEVQCVRRLPFEEHLLPSVRAASDARRTDPDFNRLSFGLVGECDPELLSLSPESSPYHYAESIVLEDFRRNEIDSYATELGVDASLAADILDRVFYWTRGQPFLTQKICRSIAREPPQGDAEDAVDTVVAQQFLHRAAVQNEPHLAHVHRAIVESPDCEALLNLYGRFRKGGRTPADLGSPLQRRLIECGLLEIDNGGELGIRNRLYREVFTTRWANENLPVRWRVPAAVAAGILLLLAVPFWYTQALPGSYVDLLSAPDTPAATATAAWRNLRSFPGHRDNADRMMLAYLQTRAQIVDDVDDVAALATIAERLTGEVELGDRLIAAYRDREAAAAARVEDRDAAVLAAIRALRAPTSSRRARARQLISDDYPLLRATLPPVDGAPLHFNPGSLLLTDFDAGTVRQWSLASGGIITVDTFPLTAAEVRPLVRRIAVDAPGVVSRIGLVLNLRHARHDDLRIKLIAPSGRAVEIDTGRERSASPEDLRIDVAQLQPLVGEAIAGTWSLSIRDEGFGVSGHLGGWTLSLNSQGLVEDFDRGIDILDPDEVVAGEPWVSQDGRFAVARAERSDSVRVWDLAFGKPLRVVAVGEEEAILGVDADAQHLVTATADSVHLWGLASGARSASLDVGNGAMAATVSADGRFLLVPSGHDSGLRFERWSLAAQRRVATLTVAGGAALVAGDAAAARIAVADYDQSVRVWDLASGAQLAQIDLEAPPSVVAMSADGEAVGIVHGRAGFSIWRVAEPGTPLVDVAGGGDWQLQFAPAGNRVVAGHSRAGFQVYRLSDGLRVGPAFGSGRAANTVLDFATDEQMLVSGDPSSGIRFWSLPPPATPPAKRDDHEIWAPAGHAVLRITPDGKRFAIGDSAGHVHLTGTGDANFGVVEEVSYLGHAAPVRAIVASADSRYVASAAADGTVRIWQIETRLPLPATLRPGPQQIAALEFAADAETLVVAAGTRVHLYDTGRGAEQASEELGAVAGSLAVAASGDIYIGTRDGRLQVMTRDAAGGRILRTVWQGAAAIEHLRIAPQQDALVLVDATGTARAFDLLTMAEAQAGLRLPGVVIQVEFSPAGTQVLFRGERWLHRARSSPAGLSWIDAAVLPAARIDADFVFGDSDAADVRRGRTVIVPVAGGDRPRLVVFGFADEDDHGLLGNRDDLLADWERRLLGDEPAIQR